MDFVNKNGGFDLRWDIIWDWNKSAILTIPKKMHKSSGQKYWKNSTEATEQPKQRTEIWVITSSPPPHF
jgi:hypothetical protein